MAGKSRPTFRAKKHPIAARFETGEIEYADRVIVQVLNVATADVLLGFVPQVQGSLEISPLVPKPLETKE